MNQEDKTKSKKMVDDVLLEYKEKIDGKIMS